MGDAFSVVRIHADHGDVAEEVPALVPGLDAFRGVGDLVADAGKVPEGGAGAGCAAGFGLDHRNVVVIRRFRAHELAGEVAGGVEAGVRARIPLWCSLFGLQCPPLIKSFADPLTEKIFRGDELTKKESRQLGDIRIDKAQERLLILNHSAEKELLTLNSLHYHKLHGTGRYSIDANSRNSKWRITFVWADQEFTDVSLVKIEDTH